VSKEPNDLSFREGDIIEVVAEMNADWWTGKLNGKQGIFPSNYVEKMSRSLSPPSYPSPSGPPPEASLVPYSNSGPPIVYPPPPQPYNPYLGQPGQQQVVVQQAPPPKPNRFGGLGQVVRV
jgi:LAS seventeen-binding protein 1/2